MSEASSDFRPRPAPATPRRAQAVPRSRRAEASGPAPDPRLGAALSFDNPSYPLDPPIDDVRIPVKEPHAAATAYSRNALRHQFPSAEVGDDLHLLFTEPGENTQSRLSPDVFVALAVPRRSTRADYDADVLGPPDFVLEVLSRSTWEHDVGRKLDCYQRIGVRECLLFDVTGENLAGAGKDLWGFALTPKRRKPLKEVLLPNGERGVRSEVLGLCAYVAQRTPPSARKETWALTMRWHDPATAEDIPDYDEARARAEAAEHEARAERGRADAAQRETRAARTREHAARRETEAAQHRVAELEERLRQLREGT